MAPRKAKPAPAARAPAPKAAPPQRAVTQTTSEVTTASSSNRLLREAAWSRMFGRVESKNPFSR